MLHKECPERVCYTNIGIWSRMLAWGRLQSNQTMKNTKCMYIYMYSSIWLGPRAGRETSLFNEVYTKFGPYVQMDEWCKGLIKQHRRSLCFRPGVSHGTEQKKGKISNLAKNLENFRKL